jgi:MerC mercury resistance protein
MFNMSRSTDSSITKISRLDHLGMGLSLLCAIHCALTPFALFLLPLFSLSLESHPWFHELMALIVVPVGGMALGLGYRHHRNLKVLLYGLPGIFIVGIAPLYFHDFVSEKMEWILMISGSLVLVYAHWLNRKSCRCLHDHKT